MRRAGVRGGGGGGVRSGVEGAHDKLSHDPYGSALFAILFFFFI